MTCVCSVCEDRFNTRAERNQHCDDMDHWQCGVCKDTFGSREALKHHRQMTDHELEIGRSYSTRRLRREGFFPIYDRYVKSKCKWKLLEKETFVKMCPDGHSRRVTKIVLEGKPITRAGNPRVRPIKIERIG